MLVGQNLSWSHQASLRVVVDSHQHGNKSDNGLAAAHIALQKSVHLLARFKVFTNLAQHSFLGVCQGKGQKFIVKLHYRRNLSKDLTRKFSSVEQFIFDEPQLIVKQFLKFEPPPRLFECLPATRQVNIPKGLSFGNKAVLLHDFGGQRLANVRVRYLQQVAHCFSNHFAINKPLAKFDR